MASRGLYRDCTSKDRRAQKITAASGSRCAAPKWCVRAPRRGPVAQSLVGFPAPALVLLRTTCAATNKKKCARRIRTHAAQKEGCAERIAPIGTLSQNGYGEDHGTHKRTMGKPDVGPRSDANIVSKLA